MDTFTSHVRMSWAFSFLSCFLPSPGVRYSRTYLSYHRYVDGRTLGLATCSSQYVR
ncbi:hypothetical protein MPTA5024_13585 [Microbispora sp. ATCC PTA-5024]|nr:hypothetical protein MPTA5024_13585 [Microbispora sp. ATCC PTA-5024]